MSLRLSPQMFAFEFCVAKLTLDTRGCLCRNLIDSYITPCTHYAMLLRFEVGEIIEISYGWKTEQRVQVHAMATIGSKLNIISRADDPLAVTRIRRYLRAERYLHAKDFRDLKISAKTLADILEINIELHDSRFRPKRFSALYDAWEKCHGKGDIAAFDAKVHSIFDLIRKEQENEQRLRNSRRFHACT